MPLMQNLFRNLVEWAAQRFKGTAYRLDPRLPLRAMASIALARTIAILRCVLCGIAFHPSKLVFVGAGVELRNRYLIHFGRGVTLGEHVVIDGLSHEGVTIGDDVNIGPYTRIEATGVFSNLGKGASIGARSGIGAFSFIGAAGGVTIGSNVIMGQYVSFHSENHVFSRTDMPIRQQGITRQGITIEDDCWVGAKVTFLDGSHVGTGSVIAAGAVVRGFIPPFSIAAGVPAKVIKKRDDGAQG